jgi:predicted dehydrogenase
MTQKLKVGIIGCGNISPRYFEAARRFETLELFGCADMVFERAQARAVEYNTRAFTVDDMLASEADIVVNLTIPRAHGEIGLRALEAGKSVYNEKPLALSRDEARAMLDMARAKGVRVGGAPDTFLGAGFQTCRKLIDDGVIGRPIAATAWMLAGGPEPWHPDPAFFYAPGGGPMFDMGPYYVTALVSLLGPAKRVTGSAGAAYSERVVGSGPKKGEKIPVQIPTHIAGVLDFEGGAIATLVTSFDIKGWSIGIEIHGTAGSMICPDPNGFGGPVRIRPHSYKDYVEVHLTHGYDKEARGLGVADMAMGLQTGRAHRASGDLCYHVLDIMHAFHDASRESRHVLLDSGAPRPAPMPTGLKDGAVDA